jgi:hypothetical protein
MAALALYTDCEARWNRTLTAGERTQVNTLLDDASALILDAAELTTVWTAATLPATVLPVVCEVVRRGFDNPAGLQGETIGAYSWRVGAAQAGLYLTSDERRTIRRAAAKLGFANVTLTNDLPLGPQDSRYYQYADLDGVVLVNAPEPDDL